MNSVFLFFSRCSIFSFILKKKQQQQMLHTNTPNWLDRSVVSSLTHSFTRPFAHLLACQLAYTHAHTAIRMYYNSFASFVCTQTHSHTPISSSNRETNSKAVIEFIFRAYGVCQCLAEWQWFVIEYIDIKKIFLCVYPKAAIWCFENNNNNNRKKSTRKK